MKAKNILLALSLISAFTMGCKKSGDDNTPPEKPISIKGTSYTCEVLRPTLSWRCFDIDADALTYTLKFGQSASALEVKVSNLSATEFTFGEDLVISTKYYWQIIASDGKNETPSDVWEFSTVSNPIVSNVPSTPTIISPNANTKAGNIAFIWSVVVDDGGLENITYILNVNGVEYEVTGSTMKSINLPAGTCKWYVTAHDRDGNESESEHVSITLSN